MAVRTAYVGTESAGDVLTTTNFNKLPGGWIGDASITSDSSSVGGTMTDITGLSVAVTVNSNRKVRITVSCRVAVDTNSETVDVCVRESSTTLYAHRRTFSSSLVAESVSFHTTLLPSSGSHTYKVSLQRVSASGNCNVAAASTYPATITVEDIGPDS